MTRIIVFIIFITIISCSQTSKHNNSDSKLESNKILCYKTVSVGDIDICLPEIDGMTECYSNSIIKDREKKIEKEGGIGLAYYLNNSVYKQIDNIYEINYDDFFKIYSTIEWWNLKAVNEDLSLISSVIEKGYLKENWSKIKKTVEGIYSGLSIGTPILIEGYSPHNKVKSYIYISKIQTENQEIVRLLITNYIILKERIISVNYIKDYLGDESIKKAKSKNDFFVFSLIDENK